MNPDEEEEDVKLIAELVELRDKILPEIKLTSNAAHRSAVRKRVRTLVEEMKQAALKGHDNITVDEEEWLDTLEVLERIFPTEKGEYGTVKKIKF
jgi:hypothetical protein